MLRATTLGMTNVADHPKSRVTVGTCWSASGRCTIVTCCIDGRNITSFHAMPVTGTNTSSCLVDCVTRRHDGMSADTFHDVLRTTTVAAVNKSSCRGCMTRRDNGLSIGASHGTVGLYGVN